MTDLRDRLPRPDGGGDRHDPRGLKNSQATDAAPTSRSGDAPGPRQHPRGGTPGAVPSTVSQPVTPVDPPRLWLRRGDQVFVAVLLGTALFLMTLHWLRLSDFGRQPVEIERLPALQYEYRIEINSASWVEFAQFDGIGETLARRIVDYRQKNGPFTAIDDLLQVPGIGPAKLAAMRKHLDVAEPLVSP